MKRYYYLAIGLVIAILLTIGAPVSADITGAHWHGIIRVTNTGTATTGVSTNFTLDTSAMIDNDYMASASDAIVLYGGVAVPFMPGKDSASPWCIFVNSIGAGQNVNYDLYTDNVTGGKLAYFPGSTGMAVTDNGSLEWGNSGNATFEGWFNPASGGYLFSKGSAIAAWGNGSGNVSIGLPNSADLLYASASSEYCKKDAAVVSPAVGATITLEGWFYVNALTGNPQIIVACGDDALTAGTGWGLSMSNTQHMLFQVGTGAAWATNWAQTGNVTLNAWHFITARYDNTATPKTAVYIDGAVVAGTDIGVGGNIASPNARSAVGAYYSSTSDYIGFFNGYIDEVRVSNNARTLANHVATYGGGAGIQFTLDANATSLWHFSEGTGNPADATANHNDLTAVNTPTWSGNSPIAGGTVLVSSAVISVGVRTITPYIFGGRLGIMVDGVATSIAYAANITNNNDPWNLLTGNIMPYANSINITQGITLRGSWAWEYGATFTDLSLNGNTATPSFRTTSSDADVSASLISLQPVTEAEYTSVTATSASGIVIGTPSAPLKLYTDEDYSKIPGADAINAMIDASGTTPEERIPREMWWFPFIFGIIGISGLCIYGVTTHEGAQGTLWAPIIVIEVGYVVAGLLNPIGFFCAILFLLPAITCLTADKHYSMG